MKRRFIHHLYLTLFLTLIFSGSYGQLEPVLTQYMFNMQTVNPAYAGMWEKIGFNMLVRKQWAGINRTPLTQVISFYSPTRNEKVGLGLNIVNDRFGYENKLNVYGDYAYEVALKPHMLLRLGLKYGFSNYNIPLSELELDPYDEYDPIFAHDIDQKFLANFGVGGFLYTENYYVGLSIPKMLRNRLETNVNNFNFETQIHTVYLTAGYVFRMIQYNYLAFKPTLMLTYKQGLPLQYDVGLNWMLREKIWLGVITRSGNALCFITQWITDNNLRIGYAMDITYNELFPYQFGTYEMTLGFSLDFFGRSYIREKFF